MCLRPLLESLTMGCWQLLARDNFENLFVFLYLGQARGHWTPRRQRDCRLPRGAGPEGEIRWAVLPSVSLTCPPSLCQPASVLTLSGNWFVYRLVLLLNHL